jgi:hypothetical protein
MGVVSQLVACAAPAEEAGTSHDELAADQNPLPTTHGLIKAGDPYIPVLDDRPLSIDGATPCIKAPRIEMTMGRTELDAQIIASRRELMNRLDLGVDGVPINVAKLAGATGTARLAVETQLDESSLNIIFQAKGAFESAVVGVGETPRFDPAKVGTCGWGYVKKAHHRLAALVMVTIESTDHMRRVQIGCAQGQENCKQTGVSTPVWSATASIENTLRAGKYNVKIRAISDAIPGLPDKPLGGIIAIGGASEDAAKVSQTMAQLSTALDWLGKAETAIKDHINTVTADPTKGKAPTAKVEFAYYEGVTADQKISLHDTYDNVIKLREDAQTTLARAATWDAFKEANAQGFGHMFNVPDSPVGSVRELEARADEAIGDDGFLHRRRTELENKFMRCEETAKTADVRRIATDCTRLGAAPWQKDYDAKYGVRRLVPVEVRSDWYKNVWPLKNCPDGTRLPRVEEQRLVSPASHVTAARDDQGIFLQENGNFAGWIKSGKHENPWLVVLPATTHVMMCFPNAGLFAEPPR